jgi:flagellar M-ring protein FliF
MLEQLNTMCQSLTEKVRHLSLSQRFLWLGIPAVGLAVGGVMIFLWGAAEPEQQQVLYSQLNMQDAGAVVTKLKEMKVPYALKGDGTTILVPVGMVYDTRLRLATEGIPQGGGVGYEIFDQRSLGVTDFMQKLNYRRALQGELARTISHVTGVHSARVHLVIPEKALFREQQEKTTASVVLTLVPGRRLSKDQIRGITQLVASSVPGLTPQDVVIVDDTGQMLRQEEPGGNALTQNEAQLAHQRALESDLERKVQTLLEPVVGKGKVRARVSAALDFQLLERTEERFDAENPALRSQQRVKEEGSGVGFWAVGTPGVRPNVPEGTAPAVGTNDNKASSTRQSETINNELSKTVTKIVAPTGEIKKLTVAVLVDGVYQAGNSGERQYTPRSAEELAKYREIVKSAVGFNETRGDRVDVADAPFDTQAEVDPAFQSEAQRAFWAQLIRYSGYIILALLGCLFIARPLFQWLTGRQVETVVEAVLPRTVQELEAGMGIPAQLPAAEAAMGAYLAASQTATVPTGATLRTQVMEIAKRDPDQAIEVLRMWLKRG